MKKLQRQK